MTALAVLAAAAVTGVLVHVWHVVNTCQADVVHYDQVHRDATPTRQVVADADREHRLRRRLERENARLRQVAYDLYDRLADGPYPRPVVRLPAPSVHRLGWRDRARWFTPWPQAAITHRRQA